MSAASRLAGLEVRAATAEDRGAVVRLVVAHLEERAGARGVAPGAASTETATTSATATAAETWAGVERAVELALAPRALAWLVVARRSGVLCGVLLANPSISPVHGGAVLRIEVLHVDRPYRRRGVGRALIEFVCGETRLSSLAAVEMMVGLEEEAVRGLGHSLGFGEVEGRLLVRSSAK